MMIAEGDTIPDWVMPAVRPERMRTMAAILRDPNPVHWDAAVVAKLGFGEHTINQGPLGLSYMINMLHTWAGPDCIRRIVMRFPQVVLDGDRVVARGKVTGVRQEAGRLLADCDIWLELERASGDCGERGRARRGRLLEGSAVVEIDGTPGSPQIRPDPAHDTAT
jgi:acyl dehydratase